MDITVNEDNGYFSNGTSSHLVILVKDNDGSMTMASLELVWTSAAIALTERDMIMAKDSITERSLLNFFIKIPPQ